MTSLQRGSRRRALALAPLLAAVLAIGSSLGAPQAATAATAAVPGDDAIPFYQPPATLPAANGDIVRSEPMTWYLDPLKVTRFPGKATRLLYRTTDNDGQPIAVSGALLVPSTTYTGPGASRPIIGYAAGTQGMADRCAPSRAGGEGTEYESLFVSGLLAAGYAVVLTDYQGLGTPGVHTYMNRRVQGHAVLDSVRAAQRLPGTGLAPNGPVALAGYSQGGGASAAAAELAGSYAPELDLKGSVSGAVPADLAATAKILDGSLYSLFLGYAVNGLAAGYGLDMSQYLNAPGLERLESAKDTCVTDLLSYSFMTSRDLTKDGRPLTEYFGEEPFRSVLADSRIGTIKPKAPALVVHSLADDIIPYSVGKRMASDWCDRGARVTFHTSLVPTHAGGTVPNFVAEMAYLDARFRGWAPLTNCWAV
ncbi:lipase family protein [Janibacter sp. G56]|uniref:lipase family protein n=1 Tax=Janibacter sp. G56 TaxID=3418717 RepID=UPI003D0650E0